MMANSSSSASTATSARYQRLVEVLDLALTKGRSQLDVEKTVKECYGDDGDNAVFQSLLEGLLESVHREVTADTLCHFQQKQVETKLRRLDAAIRQLEHERDVQKRQAAREKAAAEKALQKAQLPEGVTAHDWVQYQTYQRLLQEKKLLGEEIAAEEAAVAQLEATQSQQARTASQRVQEMQAVSKELEKSADLCSMVS